MIDLAAVQARLGTTSLVRTVDKLPRGHVRLETAFLYPDGSSIDLFLENRDPLLPPEVLTDLGQTTTWLLDVQVKPWLSKKRQRFVEDALRIYDVAQAGGALQTRLDADLTNLPDAVVRLGQACLRVADLTYTRRTSVQTGIAEELEEIIADANLEYEAGAELPGRYGKVVPIDFLVRGRRTRSAVLTWAAGNSSTAHNLAIEAFRRWHDLSIPERPEQRVTVFDDRFDSYRDDDVKRLRDVSEVLPLSDGGALRDLLAA